MQPATEPFRRHGLGYSYEPPEIPGIRLLIDRLHERGEYLTAEITVVNGNGLHLFGPDRTTLNTERTRTAFVKGLVAKTGGYGVESWSPIVETLCTAVLRAHRAGFPLHQVGAEPPDWSERWQVTPILAWGVPTEIYGPWSAGKGQLAVGMSVAVAAGVAFAGHAVHQGCVLYLDWESTEQTFDQRVWRVSRGLGLPAPPRENILYQRCRGKFTHQLERIADVVDQHAVRLMVVDSVGMASGHTGESGRWEDTILELYEGLRFLACSHCLIDHVSGEGRKGQLAGKAYGTEYKMVGARMAWEVRKEQAYAAQSMVLGLYNTKPSEGGPILPPIGIRVKFDPGVTKFEPADIREAAELERRMPQHEQVRAILVAEGPKTVKELAQGLEVSQDQIRSLASRYRELFTRLPDGRWAVVSEKSPGGEDRWVAPALRTERSEWEPIPDDEIPF